MRRPVLAVHHQRRQSAPGVRGITEPTDGNIYRGQRGRMEIRVDVKGVSCHGSAPERGDNAIYKMAEILMEVKELNDRLHYDPFLGKGTLAVSEIFFTSPSRCAVADSCSISIDRRLTDGETYESAGGDTRAAVREEVQRRSVHVQGRPSFLHRPGVPDGLLPDLGVSGNHITPGDGGSVPRHKANLWWTSGRSRPTACHHGTVRHTVHWLRPGSSPGARAQRKTWKADLVKCAAIYAALPTCYRKRDVQ